MVSAILKQVDHPKEYTPDMLFKQAALHMLKQAPIFYPLIKPELKGQSYVSYCKNLFNGRRWGDDLVCAAIGQMWNLPVTIIPVTEHTVVHCNHDEFDDPRIVLIANGGSPTSHIPCTHFSATRSSKAYYPKPGNREAKIYKYSDKVVARRNANAVIKDRLENTVICQMRLLSNQIDTWEDFVKDTQERIDHARRDQGELEIICHEAKIDLKKKIEYDEFVEEIRKKQEAMEKREEEKEKKIQKQTMDRREKANMDNLLKRARKLVESKEDETETKSRKRKRNNDDDDKVEEEVMREKILGMKVEVSGESIEEVGQGEVTINLDLDEEDNEQEKERIEDDDVPLDLSQSNIHKQLELECEIEKLENKLQKIEEKRKELDDLENEILIEKRRLEKEKADLVRATAIRKGNIFFKKLYIYIYILIYILRLKLIIRFNTYFFN